MLLDRLLGVLALATATGVAANSAPSSTNNPKDPERPFRGVNLGGWLVLEPWITPSIFEEAGPEAVDEFTLSKVLGSEARSRLSAHWDSWVSQEDFSRIASAGLTHVRIPIGYWAVNPIKGEPYVQGQVEMMDKAIKWAKKSNLKVIIDLHGAPGSQNGFDNSGRRGPVRWQTDDTVPKTVEAIHILAKRYAQQTDVVAGIELLNEPFPQEGVNIDGLKQYYYDGWGTVRESDQNTGLVISDAFQGVTFWNGFMGPSSEFNNVVVDTHHYQVFVNEDLARSVDEHVAAVCELGKDDIAKGDKPTFTGEWSGALTDCAKHLNGRGFKARYDGKYPDSKFIGSCEGKTTGSVSDLPKKDRKNIRRYIEGQLDAYEMGAGWFFWTWKTEGAPEWDMQQLLAAEVFPQPLDDRRFPGQCD